jgi:hypothetical protein
LNFTQILADLKAYLTYPVVKYERDRLKKAMIDIHNQCCIAPTSLETASITQSCIEDILEEVADIYLKKDQK